MRLYEIQVVRRTRFAGSQAEARALRAEMLAAEDLGPRSPGGTISEVDVPITKQDLLRFLNELARRADPAEPEAEAA